MAWTKSSNGYTGFAVYSETHDYGDDTYTTSSAIPTFSGGGIVIGTQTGSAATQDEGTTITLQVSLDGSSWFDYDTATVAQLVSGTSYKRVFAFDLTGVRAPYIRFYSPLTTHTGTNAWSVSVPKINI